MKLCIIPARGGSKRIPRKNIKLFHGKPLIAYSIEVAIASQCFDRVIVSTDDAEVASIAQSYGAETPFIRPADISDDFATTSEVINHAIRWFQHYEVVPPDYVCCVYPTAPFLQVGYLKEGLELLIRSGKDYVISMTEFSYPIQRALKLGSDQTIDVFFPEFIDQRSQDLEASYHDAGQFYWGKASAFLSKVDDFSPASKPIILPRHFVQDIDTPSDWEYAELMYELLLQKGKISN